MPQNRRSTAPSFNAKGVFASVVIVLCVSFLVWRLWPSGPVVIEPPKDAFAQWEREWSALQSEHAAKQDATYWALSRITVNPSDDRSGGVVTGRLASQAELAMLKATIAKVQPSIPLTWQVTIGP